MRTSNGQDIRQAVVLINISDGARNVPEVEKSFNAQSSCLFGQNQYSRQKCFD